MSAGLHCLVAAGTVLRIGRTATGSSGAVPLLAPEAPAVA